MRRRRKEAGVEEGERRLNVAGEGKDVTQQSPMRKITLYETQFLNFRLCGVCLEQLKTKSK